MRSGIAALIFVALLSFAMLLYDNTGGALGEAYSQVVVVVCGQGYGTGWFVNHDHVVTAFHVVQECAGGAALLVRGQWSSAAALEAYDAGRDVAVLRVEDPPGWAEGLPLSYEVTVGDPVYVIGYPIQLYQETRDVAVMSLVPRVASGTVSWVHPIEPIFQFDIPTDAGNSGGPVVSKETGGVVGLVVYARPGVVSEGYFGLRMDYVATFLEEHGVEYRVARAPPAPWVLLGAGALAVAALLAARARR